MSTHARIILAPLAAALAAVIVPGVAPGNGGPSPGIVVGWKGVVAPGGATRYVALQGRHDTVVAVVLVRGGEVRRWAALRGFYGVPQVAFDGTTEGLTRDGRTLVLGSYASPPQQGVVTRFAVLDTKRLKLRRVITLRGSYSFDALSPDGASLYVTQYLASQGAATYRVRVVDVERGRLIPGAITDRRLDVSIMSGQPVARARSRDGIWAYTLYGKERGLSFVHALDTRGRRAFCIELPWRGALSALWDVRMAVTPGGTLVLREGDKRLAAIDTRAFAVRAFARPAA